MNPIPKLVGAAALVGLLTLSGCGSDDSAARPPSRRRARPAGPTGGPGGAFDPQQFQKIRDCLDAAGLGDVLPTDLPTDLPVRRTQRPADRHPLRHSAERSAVGLTLRRAGRRPGGRTQRPGRPVGTRSLRHRPPSGAGRRTVLTQAVLAVIQAGETVTDVAARFRVSRRPIRRG